jgi:hypothetical protein
MTTMGADFLLTCVRTPSVDENELHTRIDKLCSNALRDVLESIAGCGPDEWEPGRLGSEAAETWQEGVRTYLKGAVTQVFFSPRRDVTTLTLDCTEWTFTGGMSWGDSPTDAFDLVEAIAITGIVDTTPPITNAIRLRLT